MNKMYNALAIIVLYKREPSQSSTYQSLKTASYLIDSPLHLLLYDNSPDQCKQSIAINDGNLEIEYIHDPSNSGLNKAYNLGIKIAKSKKIDWLLLLDQDTQIPSNYLKLFISTSNLLLSKVVCVLPKVLAPEGQKIISPVKVHRGDRYQAFTEITPGILTENISGINSGTFLSVDFMSKLNGFDKRFPLDMLDHWYFSEIVKAKQKVLLLDISIYHNLSVNSFENEVSLTRYKNILKYEKIFYSRSLYSYLIFEVRLLKRLMKQITYKDKAFFYLTLKKLFGY